MKHRVIETVIDQVKCKMIGHQAYYKDGRSVFYKLEDYDDICFPDLIDLKQVGIPWSEIELKDEGYNQHRANIIEAAEFIDNALQEAFTKELGNLVLQEVYSLTKAIRLLQEAENQIDIVRHIKKKQDV